MSPAEEGVVAVAVPSPLRRLFDYLPPLAGPPAVPGVRVRVPFGRRVTVGVVIARGDASPLPRERLRRIERVLDAEPVLDAAQLRLLEFTSEYFQHPVGAVLAAMLPSRLRRGLAPEREQPPRWRLTSKGRAALAIGAVRGPRQREVMTTLAAGGPAPSASGLGVASAVLERLERRGLVARQPVEEASAVAVEPAPELNREQRLAVEAVLAHRDRFAPYLLEGVTGSGKTEVYLSVIESIVADGRQALVLVPEIGLTPQTVRRFERRLGVRVAAMHSGLSEGERLDAWLRARDGRAAVLVGTRSAVFAPLPRLGIVIVDEEHDPSFKQQDGVRYSARDLAVVRARDADVPVILGSATPSLETLHNADTARYRRLALTRRAGGASAPRVEVIDLRGRSVEGGMSQPLLEAIAACLADGQQAILFVNRRGYAPVLLCRECGEPVDCERCDAHLVLHADDGRVHCHHCGHSRPAPERCACGAAVRAVGVGTERVLEALGARLPEARVRRVDRDSTRRRGAMVEILDQVAEARVDVLVGTQMLAKGHDFPGVTLVGILDADCGLFSSDFRASERMAQLFTQVSGRAGRAERPGRVLIQTHHPDNALLRTLVTRGYRAFGEAALEERRQAGLPPFGHLALMRAEAVDAEAARAFLDAARAVAPRAAQVTLLGPVAAPMPRRAGRHRSQLLVEATGRGTMQRFLRAWLERLGELPESRRTRWSLDVDPQDMG